MRPLRGEIGPDDADAEFERLRREALGNKPSSRRIIYTNIA